MVADIRVSPDDSGTAARCVQYDQIVELAIPPLIYLQDIGRNDLGYQTESGQVLTDGLGPFRQVQSGKLNLWAGLQQLCAFAARRCAGIENTSVLCRTAEQGGHLGCGILH